MAAQQPDRIDLPPVREEFRSPDGRYTLTISAADAGWRSRKSVASLTLDRSAETRQLWTHSLPHEYRPRFALVDDSGRVALFDEWINVLSRRAVVVLDARGDTMAEHGFDAVAKTVGRSRADIARLAKHGAWIQTPPALAPAGGSATVRVGDSTLSVNLSTGAIGVAGGS